MAALLLDLCARRNDNAANSRAESLYSAMHKSDIVNEWSCWMLLYIVVD